MKKGQKTTNEKKFTIKMQKKLVVLFVLVLLAFAGLSVRLIWINREDGQRYKRQVLIQQEYDSTTIPYRRGDILDSKGTGLAVSEKVYNLVIDSKVILSDEDYFEPTMQALSSCFELNMDDVRNYVQGHADTSYYVPLKRLTYDQISAFLEMKNDTENNPNIKGIWFEEEYKRVYPYNSLACDALGFLTTDGVGTFGLEEYYNEELNGTTGREYGYVNEDSTLERTTKPAVDGNSIVTTIDANIQGIVEKYIKQFNDEHKNLAREGEGSNNTGCIIMDVDTGNILAMASYPVFDLNNPRDISAYYTEEQVQTMEDDGTYYDTLNALWRNYCISDTYEPGSTSKPFTVATGLETGKISRTATYQCNGSLEVGGRKIRCHSSAYGGDGLVTVKQAIEQSCNVALMYMGMAIGKETFSEYQQNFNFGLKTNIDLAGEARTSSLIYPVDKMGPTELATNTFGQGFNVTMIQMISGFCSLINGGYYYEPHMVSKIVSPSGATVKNIEPRLIKQTISKSTSDTIIDFCNGVVTEGTGKTARPAGYAIGGKTGTAETQPRGNKEYVVSFMGYAPADDPQIAIYVVVDRPNAAKQDDAKFATGIVRNILSEVLPYMNIFMTEELSEAETKELADKQLEITTMYSQMSETVSGNESEEEESPEDTSKLNMPWKEFPIDPTTGYAVNPVTGEQVDPDTGDSVESSFSAFE